jgi:hypothetical protein
MWFQVRIVLFTLGFLVALAAPIEQPEELHSMQSWMLGIVVLILLVSLLLIPCMILIVIGVQSVNPLSDQIWTRPNHHVNPFHFGNPLLFFHFAAYLFGSCALGVLFSSLWRGSLVALEGCYSALCSLMVLVGVQLSMRVFKRKLPEVIN